jgi:hypothetical protein
MAGRLRALLRECVSFGAPQRSVLGDVDRLKGSSELMQVMWCRATLARTPRPRDVATPVSVPIRYHGASPLKETRHTPPLSGDPAVPPCPQVPPTQPPLRGRGAGAPLLHTRPASSRTQRDPPLRRRGPLAPRPHHAAPGSTGQLSRRPLLFVARPAPSLSHVARRSAVAAAGNGASSSCAALPCPAACRPSCIAVLTQGSPSNGRLLACRCAML